jgi:hypothetical protein
MDTIFIIGGIGYFEWKMFKNVINASFCFLINRFLINPRKTSTLPAFCAQTIDQNIGQPLQECRGQP